MVDQEIIDLPNDDGETFDLTEKVPMQKNAGDTRNRSWGNIAAGLSLAGNVIKTTNTDISTDIQVPSTSQELKLTGTTVISNSKFTIVGNAIQCNFTGRIKVTGMINNKVETITEERQLGKYSVAINGVAGILTTGIIWYNRNIDGVGEGMNSGATIVEILDVVDDDLISIFNTQISGDKLVIFDAVGGSSLQIEILQVGVFLDDSFPFTWGVTDEDSLLSVGIKYTTEAVFKNRTIKEIIFSLKNAPTGSPVIVDLRKETAQNSNSFSTIFSTIPEIDITKFTSQDSVVTPVFSDNIWESGKRMQIVVTGVDSANNATGLKGTIVTT